MKKLKKIISTILITVILISNTQSLVLYANENTNNIIEIEDVNSNLNVIRKTDKKEKTIDTIKPELISIEVIPVVLSLTNSSYRSIKTLLI